MKICVADDEREVRESIVLKLQQTHPYVNVFDAGYGAGALEHIKLIRPELVFADIRMPELNGLELLAQVMQSLPKSKVIMLTGYSDFEYARKAVHLGAADYLLKPADCDELKAIVQQTYEQLGAKLLSDVQESLKYMPEAPSRIQGVQFANIAQWLDERVLKTIRFERSSGHTENNEELICSFDWNGTHVRIAAAAPAYTGGLFSRPDELGRVWSHEWETRMTHDFFGKKQIHSVRFKATSQEAAGSLRIRIIQAVLAANEDKLREGLTTWFASLQRMQLRDLQEESAKLISMIDSGVRHSQTLFIMDHKHDERWLREVEKHTSWDGLQAWLQEWILERLASSRPETPQADSMDRFDTTLRLLEQRTDMDLTLESLAEEVGVHPVTLSRMFKQRTGLSFVRYMTRKRLEKAKQWLLEGDRTISELAEQLGYQDHRYFATLFKNEYGLTPGDYRKHCKK